MRLSRAVSGGVIVAATIAACVTLQLSSTRQESVVVSPASIDLGAVQIGSSAPVTIQVSPAAGEQDDTVVSLTSCAQFPITPVQLPQGVFRHCISGSGSSCIFDVQTFSFVVSFQPTLQGTASCPVTIKLGTGVNQIVTVQGTGTAEDHVAEVLPKEIDFGQVRKGTTSSGQTLSIRNAGAKDLDVAAITSSDDTIFAIAPKDPGPHAIKLGTTELYTVTCTPPDTTDHSGSVTIESDDKTSPAVVLLTCSGIDSNLGIDPSPAHVTTRVGAPVDITVTVSNSGTAASTLDSVTLGSDSSPELAITSVTTTSLAALTGTSVVTMHYSALTHHPDGPLGSLVVQHDGNLSDIRTTPVSAAALLATVASQPTTVDFGPVCIDQHVDQLVAVYAADDGAFVIDSFDNPTSPFALVYSGPAMPTAMPERANDIPFTVSVQASTPGDVTSAVIVRTDAPGGAASYSVALHAHALPAGVTATPAVADFGVATVDTTSSGQTIQLTNCSAGAINVTAAHIDGFDASSFALVSPTQVAMQLQTAQSEQFIVVLSPHVVGGKQAQLVLEYDGGTAMIELDGDVTAGADTMTKTRDSYYTCSAGGSSAWPVLAIVLLGVRRRRRRERA